jgi:hypothetical protein
MDENAQDMHWLYLGYLQRGDLNSRPKLSYESSSPPGRPDAKSFISNSRRKKGQATDDRFHVERPATTGHPSAALPTPGCPPPPTAPPRPLTGGEWDEPVLRVPGHRKMADSGSGSPLTVGTTKEGPCTGFAGAIHLLHFWITMERNSIFGSSVEVDFVAAKCPADLF